MPVVSLVLFTMVGAPIQTGVVVKVGLGTELAEMVETAVAVQPCTLVPVTV